MSDHNTKLTVLWTSDNLLTVKHMIFMYVTNAKKLGWWDEVTLLIWGASAALIAIAPELHSYIKEMQETGVHISACKACADDLNVTEQLEALGIEVKYWGIGLTDILQSDGKLLTV